ncbi:MAG: UDP-N-acetylmuramoyl-tripeptide--D-alanyl-D-alanine ligase [Clostridia bacterium]
MKYSLKEIALITGGKVFGDENAEITGFFTDSRQAESGKMFVAIVGEKTDGHSYITMVLKENSAILCEKKPTVKGNFVMVKNSILALQQVALNYRQKFKIPHIAITGSVGKTTTKEMVALALESQLDVLKTLGNANSQIGLPRTLMSVENHHEVAVIEMGMSVPGEMEKIAYCARPDIVVFTNVGVSHIEFHGTKEKIMEQKLHIADYFNKDNVMFVNGDDQLLATLKSKNLYKVVEFGTCENCDYRAVNLTQNANGTKFTCVFGDKQMDMFIPVVGLHNVQNALASFAVADYLNLNLELVAKALASYIPPQMRQQIVKTDKFTIIDDSYNASPDSMVSSLNILSSMTGGKKIAVLADMLELGDYSQKGHKKIGEYAKTLGIDYVIAFGDESKNIVKGFGNNEKSSHFTDYDMAEYFLLSLAKKDDTILCKGSRGMQTDRFVKALKGE